MYKYELIIYWSDEDESYIAVVPELPGCTADGITYSNALENVESAISESIETARIARPRYPSASGKAHLCVILPLHVFLRIPPKGRSFVPKSLLGIAEMIFFSLNSLDRN